MVPAPYRYCFKLFKFFRSCKILFGLVKFKTAPDRMSGNVWEVFVNTDVGYTELTCIPDLGLKADIEGQILGPRSLVCVSMCECVPPCMLN